MQIYIAHIAKVICNALVTLVLAEKELF